MLVLVVDHPFTANRQIEDEAFHAEWAVNKEIQIAFRINRRQPRHQVGVKRVAR